MGRALLVLDGDEDRRKAVHWIGKAPVGTRVEFKASKRSLPQNDLMWALLTEFSQQFQHNGKKYSPTEWKSIFLHAFGREIDFLPSLDGKTFLPIEMSSSDLSKQEMTDFIEFILKEAADRGVILQNPKEQNSGADPQPEAEGAALSSPQEPADTAPKSAGSEITQDEIRTHLMDFARKALATAGDSSLPDPKRLELVEFMQANYRDVLPDTEWGKLSTIMIGVQAVLSGKRTIEQARRFFAVDLLDTTVEELGG